jgi:PAS domain S-box-containing protein
MKTKIKFLALFGGVFILVALGVIFLILTFKQVEQNAQVRAQTKYEISSADNLLSGLKDAETGQRGYLLTGNEAFLSPYLIAKDKINGQLAELEQINSDSAVKKHLDVLTPLVNSKMAELSQSVALYQNHDTTGAIAIVQNGLGNVLMDSIRTEISSIDQIESNNLAAQETDYASSMRRLFTIIIISSLILLLLALSFAFLIYREFGQRLKNLAHLETQHILDIQQEANNQLQQANVILHASEEKLAVTLNSIGDGVIATDAKGLVVLMNPLAEKLTGWTKAEAIGRPMEEIFHIIKQDNRQPASLPLAATLKLGLVQKLANHIVLIARDGSECAIADSCSPIRDGESLVEGAVLVFRDVTEHNRQESLLLEKNIELESARAAADKANLAKSEFLSSMSHELRSPLNAILGFAQLMETDPQPPTPTQSIGIAQILQAGWHLLKLIDEILDLAKVESGQVTISQEPVQLAEVLRECHSMIEVQAQQKGITLIFPQDDCPYYLHADRTRLIQVIINLLSNAIKYNSAKGTVELKCETGKPGRIRISVSDTGTGLSAEQIPQLFQAFNRLGQEASNVEGTGIGLVVAKRLVELMGGEIGVQSSLGVGSVFWFELNTVPEPQISMKEMEAAVGNVVLPRTEQSFSILCIEDNQANLKLIELIIARRPNLRLLTAVNGTSGVELARTAQPDVILMDINLPDINGYEALRILRSDPRTVNIPVVALTANAMKRDIQKGLQAGFFLYITKPINVNAFMEALNEVLAFAVKLPATQT